MASLDVKRQIVESIVENLSLSPIVFVLNYRGLKANDLNDIRSKMTNLGAHSKVYKNTLLRFAFDKLGFSVDPKSLIGPSFVVCASPDDPDYSPMVKALVDFSKSFEVLNIKTCFFEKAELDHASIEALAELPSKEVLIGKTVFMIKSPLSGLVGAVSSPIRGMINVLTAVVDKKEKEGV